MNELERLLVSSTEGDRYTKQFEAEFLKAEVYLRVLPDTPDAIKAGSNEVAFYKVPTQLGSAMALYTSLDRMAQAFGSKVAYVAMAGRDALRLGRGLPVALNYGLLPAVVWTAEEAAALVEERD